MKEKKLFAISARAGLSVISSLGLFSLRNYKSEQNKKNTAITSINKHNDKTGSFKTPYVTSIPNAVFNPDFSFHKEILQAKEKALLSYSIIATPDVTTLYHDIKEDYCDIPIDTAFKHINAEYNGFNENLPEHYIKSRGYPLMRVIITKCELEGRTIPLPEGINTTYNNPVPLLQEMINTNSIEKTSMPRFGL